MPSRCSATCIEYLKFVPLISRKPHRFRVARWLRWTLLVNLLNITAMEFAVRHSGTVSASKLSPRRLCELRFSSFGSDCAKSSTYPSSPKQILHDSAIRDLYPFKCRCGVARTRSNHGGLFKAFSRRSQPFRLQASINAFKLTNAESDFFFEEAEISTASLVFRSSTPIW